LVKGKDANQCAVVIFWLLEVIEIVYAYQIKNFNTADKMINFLSNSWIAKYT